MLSSFGTAACVAFTSACCVAEAQNKPSVTTSATSSTSPASWVKAAADRQVHIIEDEGSFPLTYHVRKVDNKGDTTREVIETREGSVARLVERNGRPLTHDEDEAERSRLNDILLHPDQFLKHHKRDEATRAYSVDLVRLFPAAMRFSYSEGQPQLAGRDPQVVVDFQPDPAFQPPTLIAQLLTGLQGRIWIDIRSKTLVRSESHVIRPVNFGWGMLMRVYPGGSVIFEQALVANDRWAYSLMEDHLHMREVMVHTAEQNTRMARLRFPDAACRHRGYRCGT